MTADEHHDAMMESPSETLRRILMGRVLRWVVRWPTKAPDMTL